jgi:hypothetical protein
LVAGATKLSIATQAPSSTIAGTGFTLSFRFEDASGSLVSTASASVTLSILAGTGSVGASVTNARALAVGGIATFSNVQVNMAGTGYRLVATASLVSSVQTAAFNVLPGAAAKLAFTTQPAGALDSQAWYVQPKVTVQDMYGNKITTGSAVQVTLSAKSGASQVTLVGAASVSTVNGVATFTNLKINAAVSSVSLEASTPSGLTAGTSETFNVVQVDGYPFALVYVTKPNDAISSTAFAQSQIVRVVDGGGNIVVSAKNTISLKLSDDSPAGSLTAASVSAVGGEAKFQSISINRAGLNFKLLASSVGLVPATSDAFDVGGAASVSVVISSDSVKASAAFTVTVTVYKLGGTVYTEYAKTVSIGIKPSTGVAGATFAATTSKNAINGVATFSVSIGMASPGTHFLI